jgi:hypothetical protein
MSDDLERGKERVRLRRFKVESIPLSNAAADLQALRALHFLFWKRSVITNVVNARSRPELKQSSDSAGPARSRQNRLPLASPVLELEPANGCP